MPLDVRSLTQWVKSVSGHERPHVGGSLGTPSHDLDEAPPGIDQEANRVVSGGGVAGVDGQPGRHKPERSERVD